MRYLLTQDLQHFKQLICIFEEVFEIAHLKMPPDSYLEKQLQNPDFLVFVALQEEKNEVIGGLTIYVLHQYYAPQPSAYIYDVGISPAEQGKGIGKQLMATVLEYCKNNHFANAYVEAEYDDLPARNFYTRTPVDETLKAVHFTYRF